LWPPIHPWPLHLPLLLGLLRVAAAITFRAVGGLFTGLGGVILALFLIAALGGGPPALVLIATISGAPLALYLIVFLPPWLVGLSGDFLLGLRVRSARHVYLHFIKKRQIVST
jgi:hypothetical protein